ncbi:TPA: hypothetical protein U2D03_000490 [Streptococcus suis]|nr:hypothetical protein [Streptococcus suis]
MLKNENHQSSSEEKVLLEDVSFEDLFLSSAIELALKSSLSKIRYLSIITCVNLECNKISKSIRLQELSHLN